MWDNTQLGITYHQIKTPALGKSYIFLSHWPTVSLRSQSLKVIVKATDYLPQPDGKMHFPFPGPIKQDLVPYSSGTMMGA